MALEVLNTFSLREGRHSHRLHDIACETGHLFLLHDGFGRGQNLYHGRDHVGRRLCRDGHDPYHGLCPCHGDRDHHHHILHAALPVRYYYQLPF